MRNQMNNIKPFLINRIQEKSDFDLIEIYHFRSFKDCPHSFLDYKEIKALKIQDKHVLDYLSNGITVILLRSSQSPSYGLCGISFCSENDNFNKSLGIETALKRLDNYLFKPNDGSWNYKEDCYMSLKGLPLDKDKLVDKVSKVLNQHPFMITKGYKIFNPLEVLKY